MPSQTKLLYYDTAEGGVSNDGWTTLPSGGTGGGQYNLPKDLSILNRWGLDMTTRKGTPLVYRVRVTLHGMSYDGTGAAVSGFAGNDSYTVLKVNGIQNTWLVKAAAEHWHKAREESFAAANVKKGDRGAYSHTIRYNYDGADDTWGTPIDGDGAAFTGGTWDVSKLSYTGDAEFQLKWIGSGDDSETDAFSGTVLSAAHEYLGSRRNQAADTNVGVEETPTKFNVLSTMLGEAPLSSNAARDDVVNRARGEQDNPPYEVLDPADVNHDCTEPVELGRLTVGGADGFVRSMVIDVPFGLMDVSAQHYSQADENEVYNPLWGVELLKISEMTG